MNHVNEGAQAGALARFSSGTSRRVSSGGAAVNISALGVSLACIRHFPLGLRRVHVDAGARTSLECRKQFRLVY